MRVPSVLSRPKTMGKYELAARQNALKAVVDLPLIHHREKHAFSVRKTERKKSTLLVAFEALMFNEGFWVDFKSKFCLLSQKQHSNAKCDSLSKKQEQQHQVNEHFSQRRS